MSSDSRISLTVGPMLYYWPRPALLHFYAEVADSPADTVVLGETVCSRRHEMKLDDWLALGADLQAAGKQVVLATQVLVESEADLRALRRAAEQREFMVEAGDASALHLLAQAGGPFVLGPHINVYSRAALAEHAALGAVRWSAPVELPLATVGQINPVNQRVEGIETEVFAFGRMPLAFSARCFTARHHRLQKDQCEFRCRDDADGLLLRTEDGEPFLVLNGIQTQSAAQQCLIGERAALQAAGVSRLRLSPCSQRFGEVLGWFDKVMNQGESADAARIALDALSLPGGLANGFAHGRPGLDLVGAR
ncbi:MAG: U32 family peptidase [Pseudomonadota bacterium]